MLSTIAEPIAKPTYKLIHIHTFILQLGDAAYDVRLRDGAGQVSVTRSLILSVTAVNIRPSFDIVPAILVELWAKRQSAIFAYNVTAGAGEDAAQAPFLKWRYTYNNPELFQGSPPELRVEMRGDMRVGVIYFSTDQAATGSAIFTKVTLEDGGIDDPVMGSYSSSYQETFELIRVANNKPPSFVPLYPTLEIVENSGFQVRTKAEAYIHAHTHAIILRRVHIYIYIHVCLHVCFILTRALVYRRTRTSLHR